MLPALATEQEAMSQDHRQLLEAAATGNGIPILSPKVHSDCPDLQGRGRMHLCCGSHYACGNCCEGPQGTVIGRAGRVLGQGGEGRSELTSVKIYSQAKLSKQQCLQWWGGEREGERGKGRGGDGRGKEGKGREGKGKGRGEMGRGGEGGKWEGEHPPQGVPSSYTPPLWVGVVVGTSGML